MKDYPSIFDVLELAEKAQREASQRLSHIIALVKGLMLADLERALNSGKRKFIYRKSAGEKFFYCVGDYSQSDDERLWNPPFNTYEEAYRSCMLSPLDPATVLMQQDTTLFAEELPLPEHLKPKL